MTKYRPAGISLKDGGDSIQVLGIVEKEISKDNWGLVKEFSISVEKGGDIVEQTMSVVEKIAEEDYTSSHIFVEAKAEIESKIIEFKD